jgi:hypothetical protein
MTYWDGYPQRQLTGGGFECLVLQQDYLSEESSILATLRSPGHLVIGTFGMQPGDFEKACPVDCVDWPGVYPQDQAWGQTLGLSPSSHASVLQLD